MKPYVDLFSSYKSLFIASHRLKNRFKKYWGTTTIGNVEVFNKTLTVWPNTDSRPNAVAILRMFKAYSSIKHGNFKGIESFYLKLNPAKFDNYEDISKEVIANHLNQLLPDKDFKFNINYYDPTNPNKFANWSSTQVKNWFLDNKDKIRSSSYIESSADTKVIDTISYYLLFDDNNRFDLQIVRAAVVPTPDKEVYYYSNLPIYSRSIYSYKTNITLEFKAKQISKLQDTDTIIDMMVKESDPIRKNKITELFSLDQDEPVTNESVTDTDLSIGGILKNRTDIGSNKTDTLWYKGHLRAAVLDSNYLNRDKFAKVLQGAMDTGYKKKHASFWKKLVSIVAVVASFIFAVPTGGLSVATLGAFAVNLGVAALVLTGLQFALVRMGQIGWATYFGYIIQVFNVTTTITGITAFIQNLASYLAKSTTKSLIDAAVAKVKESVAEVATAATKLAKEVSVGNVLDFFGTKIVTIGEKVVSKVIDMRVKSKKSDLSTLQRKVNQSNEELADISAKEMHLGVEDIKWYTEPLKLDHTIYEVDYLYEGTIMNIGRPSFVPYGLNVIDKADLKYR